MPGLVQSVDSARQLDQKHMPELVGIMDGEVDEAGMENWVEGLIGKS